MLTSCNITWLSGLSSTFVIFNDSNPARTHVQIPLGTTDLGLVVNESKTEICQFHNNDQPPITVMLQGSAIILKNQ